MRPLRGLLLLRIHAQGPNSSSSISDALLILFLYRPRPVSLRIVLSVYLRSNGQGTFP